MEHQYITVAYTLYAIQGSEREEVEVAPLEHPFQFISGTEYTLPKFEEEILKLGKGEKFSFQIPSAEAYGEFQEEAVQKFPKDMFCDADGEFDTEHMFVGNVVPLTDGSGQQFLATVGEITDTEVVLDFNHPHAGKDLLFEGQVVEMRPATLEEVSGAMAIHQHSHEGGCGGGGCSGCSGGCC